MRIKSNLRRRPALLQQQTSSTGPPTTSHQIVIGAIAVMETDVVIMIATTTDMVGMMTSIAMATGIAEVMAVMVGTDIPTDTMIGTMTVITLTGESAGLLNGRVKPRLMPERISSSPDHLAMPILQAHPAFEKLACLEKPSK
mgnify:CR=1 FL=1